MKRTTKIASAVATASLVAALGAGVAFAQGSNGADSIARICNGSAAYATSQTCVGGNGACAGSSCGYTDEDGNGVCDNYGSPTAYAVSDGTAASQGAAGADGTNGFGCGRGAGAAGAYADEDGNGVCDNYEACPAANGAGSGNAGGACYGYGNGNGCGQGAGNGACNGSAARAGWGYSR